MILDNDPRPAKEQINDRYAHGGGWQSFQGHTFDQERLILKYPGDPPHRAIAEAQLRDERIILFNSDWLVIVQKDGTFQVARID